MNDYSGANPNLQGYKIVCFLTAYEKAALGKPKVEGKAVEGQKCDSNKVNSGCAEGFRCALSESSEFCVNKI